MSEPKTTAQSVEEVTRRIWHWHLWDDRIQSKSDAHAVTNDEGTVLIDPLHLRQDLLARFEPVIAICLTAACHQRSAWRYRRAFGAKVYAPEGCREMEEAPDHRYTDGSSLPGGLRAVHTPGPEAAHFALLREAEPAVLFCPDLVMRSADGRLSFIPAEYHDDPDATRASVLRLITVPFQVLCFDHGAPLTANPQGALRDLLKEQ